MEQGFGSNFDGSTIDKTRVLDVKPLRCLSPVFPSPNGMSSVSTPQPSPFVCITPTGPYPPGVTPFYPFVASNESGRLGETSQQAASQGNFGFRQPISPIPVSSFGNPTANGSNVHVTNVEDSSSGRKKGGSKKPRRAKTGYLVEVDVGPLFNQLLMSFRLVQIDQAKKADGDKELVRRVLLVFDLFRRRMTQMDEPRYGAGSGRRPDLKASKMMMLKGVRTNHTKRIGNVNGVEVGDIFFFRMELCLVGLHAPTMSGIDYMSVKLTKDEEPVALSIVSAGGYNDDGGDGDMLIYTGQGGVQRKDGQKFDQKLEKGNLALEKSIHRANAVRVIRGVKDVLNPTGKIYIFDGLYTIRESWEEKNQLGLNVFKYKLLRVPGQPEAFKVWKSIQQWRDGASRVGVILPDLTSGAENQPVCLVNDVDDEKGPAYFTYIRSLKYSKPFLMPRPSLGCPCLGGCQPDDSNCPCIQRNEGFLPYSSIGVVMSHKSLIHECGSACSCPPNCRNRMSQGGPRIRLEVFKTKYRGWGLRSWDPIRAGGFICEYAGEVSDTGNYSDNDNYIFDATRTFEPLEPVRDNNDESRKVPFPLVISAKNGGNIARFMNHSCSPNAYWQLVVRESNNEAYYHIAFFAIRHIPPMQELTFDYGMDKAHHRRKKCICGSLNCKGYFF